MLLPEVLDPQLLLAAGAALALAGFVKGVLGLGLPLVSVPLLAYLFPLPQVIALLCAPILISNVYQAAQGGRFLPTFRRFWPAFAALVVGIVAGSFLLVAFDPRTLSLMLGLVVVAFALLNLASPRLKLSAQYERPVGVGVGLLGGVIGGFSSFFGPPLIMYLVALQLGRDLFVSTVAMFFLAGAMPLYVALAFHGILTWTILLHSALAVLPVMAGLALGQSLRARVPQERFRTMVLLGLTAIGISLLVRALG